MSKTNREYWKDFWAAKSDPLHSSSEDTYYDELASEMRMLLPKSFKSFLDVGCGNGVLYRRLNLDKTDYVGLDLSEEMVRNFKNRHEEVDVRVCDLRDLPQDRSFDVIFSHGVVQFISPAEFEAMLAASVPLLSKGGSIVHAGILWDKLRIIAESGVLQKTSPPVLKRYLWALATRSGLRRGMGYWYSMRVVRRQAERLGMSVRFYGSLLYPYRFHAVMKRSNSG